MVRRQDAEVGVEPEVALQARAPYYLVTQVHGSRIARPKLRGILRGMALGQTGARVIIPAVAPLIAGVGSISAYVAVRPLRDPAEVPGVGVLSGWDELPGNVVAWDDDFDFPHIEVEGGSDMSELVTAVENIGRQFRPDLNDAELQAGAKVIAADLGNDELTVRPLDEGDIRLGRERVSQAIDAARSTSPGQEPSGAH
jgi:hypothetical protein